MKVYIEPIFEGQDAGEGGIRRVVEAQRKWLPQMGIDVVDTMAAADLVATHAAVATKTVPVNIPWVVHTHGLYWSEYVWSKWGHGLNRLVIDAMRQADHVTAPSEWVAHALRRGMWLRPTVLYHGIDEADWRPGTNAGYVLWNKNRVDPICDPGPVVDLARRHSDLHFVSTLGTEGIPNLELTGVLPYEVAREWVRDAGVYLCTTRETFGIGTIEAMAAGVPVVGWNWGGQREIVDHGVSGWLAPVGDYDGLAEGIRWALANRDAVSAEARKKALAMFTWERAMARYVDLYTGVYEAKAEGYHAPKVSVIVPCFNLGRYLPDTIKSLQAQSLDDWEAVIVDDASTDDDTAAVAAELAEADSRVRVVTNPENLYLAGSLNAGIEASQGRYIIPVDADNMIDPETLSRLSASLEADRGFDIAYGAARFVLEDGVTPDTGVGAGGISGWPQDFSFMGQIQGRNQIPSTSMYRRRVWERSGGYRRRWRTAEDADFWTRATSLGFDARKVSTRPTLVYRQREDSMSRSHPVPNYPAWYPWSRAKALTPFGVAAGTPGDLNDGLCWNVPSGEPPKVGIIIPVGPGHNDLLIDALDSVEAQSYRAWQVIVVNDTGEPLDVPHPWAEVLYPAGLPERLGPGRARNIGIAMFEPTVGWFVPLDADDYLQADALDAMMRAAPDGGVIYSQWVDEFGDRAAIYDPPEYDPRLLLTKGMIHAVTALYPMAAWREVDGFDEGLVHWEDWDFHLRLAAAGICGSKLSMPLWTYRKHTGFRREENMATFAQGKEAILDRWRSYWEGGKTLMACRGCPGGGGQRYPKAPAIGGGGTPAAAGASGRAPDGYKTVEFHGLSEGTRAYKGQVTNTRYRFGNNPSHRRKFVYEADVPGLLTFFEGSTALFRVIEENVTPSAPAPQLAAPGPPGPDTPAPEPVAEEAAVAVAEPPTESAPGGNPTVKEMRDAIAKGMPSEEIAILLAKESVGANRPTAITVIEAALRKAQGR